MSLFLAKFISILFHPIFMPIFTVWLMFNSNGNNLLNAYFPDELRNRLYAVFCITTVVMPAISFYILRYNRLVSSFSMPRREERFLPYFTTLVYYGVLYYLLRTNSFPWFFLSAMIGSMLVLSMIFLINMRIKISAHAAGIAGATAIFGVLMKYNWVFDGIHIFVGLLVLCGLVSTARLSLQAHRSYEVYLGLLVGFITEFVVMNFKWYI